MDSMWRVAIAVSMNWSTVFLKPIYLKKEMQRSKRRAAVSHVSPNTTVKVTNAFIGDLRLNVIIEFQEIEINSTITLKWS